MINIKYFILLLLFLFMSASLFSQQKKNQLIREGNKNFNEENYQDAEIHYRRALEENPGNVAALYNLGNTLYKQGRYEEAINILDGLSQMELDDINKSDVYHNLGNAQLNAQQIKESIESYKKALKDNPADQDTRYNLAYAINLLDEQEEQPQDDPENGDDDQEDDQQQDQEDDQQQDQDGDQQPQQDEMQQRPDQLTQEDAERILDALNQKEQEIQEEISREESETPRIKPDKDW